MGEKRGIIDPLQYQCYHGASAPEEVSTEPEQIERQAAEDLLDALRRNEKQFLMYQQKGKGKSRVDPEKDW